MAKFLISGSYTAEGTKGLIREGGSGRKAAVEKALAGVGGRLESIYYTWGDRDVIAICDVPDAISGLALSLAINAAGTVQVTSSPLLTVEEVDAACKKSVAYRAPGS